MAKPQDWIAVFDSGLGGISVLRELVRQMPTERFFYFGDSINAPYGGRSTQQVRELTLARVSELMPHGLKAVVIACNTATAAAIDALRTRYPDTIIVGIEPALKLAAEQTTHGRIIVMATEVTLREEKFAHLMEQHQRTHDICPLPCPHLAEFVEQGLLDRPETETYLRELLSPCLTPDTEAIVLGCTHFPFLRPLIEKIAPNVRIYDGSEGTATQTRRRLDRAGLRNPDASGCIKIENSLGTAEIMERCRDLLSR